MDEIRKLQEQFKKLQEQDTSHRLSERNCVEIILKLIALKKIDLIYTMDGKEYLTPQQLEYEIKDEIMAHKGRLNVVDLQPILNVDLSHIEAKVQEIIAKDRTLQYDNGEIIANYYLDGIVEEINETLEETGELSIEELAGRFNLGVEYLSERLEQRLNKGIKAHLEDGILYTEAHVERQEAIVRGALSAFTRPVALAQVISKTSVAEKLFFHVLDKLMSQGRLAGNVQGKAERAQFVPSIFEKNREKAVEQFFKQNGYIAYNYLTKLQIANPKDHLKNKFKGLSLQTCYISSDLLIQVEANLQNAIATDSYIDVLPLLPPILSMSDIQAILQADSFLQQSLKSEKAVIFIDTYVCSKGFLNQCLALLEKRVQDNCKKPENKKLLLSDSNPEIESDAKSKKGKKAPEPAKGKKGGKGKGKKARDDDDDDEGSGKGKVYEYSALFPHEEMVTLLTDHFSELSSDLIEEIVNNLEGSLNEIAKKTAQSLFTATTDKKKVAADFSSKFDNLYFNFLLFLESAKAFPEPSSVLDKHLLKTVGNDIVNLIVEQQAHHHFIEVDKIKTASERNAIIAKIPVISKSLDKLVKTLSSEKADDFVEELDQIADKCEIKLKKFDKKASKALSMQHREELLKQLHSETDISKIYHLALVLQYYKSFSQILHIPGRFLSQVLSVLKSQKLPENVVSLLENADKEVVSFLKLDEKQREESSPEQHQVWEALAADLKKLVLG
eukprot:TRINITY_DN6880_c0_g1_i1.p1 TRINITY_DN6880_c0_g1~~TRINITY_DN6880_c0_g1_i1.p1  ORF type:complete len:728 (+),score=218.78 TRINITY_DN6880_c0_g1_i1:52-2235(+)